ncbi:hypothetical protein CISIN_1g048804mg [Citrus sinensis]|uniref:Uncharacterized protein n=1 Tax=Citrus sinensis TaxID=2711 RepID=A0A067DN51_CITSI|nr:hypothetical protein CISIN_1g048804mg [Citrus sinensis]
MALRSHALCGDMAMVGVRCCFASGCSCRWWQWQLLEGLAALAIEFAGGILCWRTGKFSCALWNSVVQLDSLPAVVVISYNVEAKLNWLAQIMTGELVELEMIKSRKALKGEAEKRRTESEAEMTQLTMQTQLQIVLCRGDEFESKEKAR